MTELAEQIPITRLNGKQLMQLSKSRYLSLNLQELLAIQTYYKKLRREPFDTELECLAQTWSEHCKHKVFNAEILYKEKGKSQKIKSLFHTYIKAATEKIARKKKGFIVKVFSDNAGIVSFNKSHDACMKVETHNHPSALDPYGGANTGVGGVIRDILGCGLGAKPVASTDIFCFAEPWLSAEKVPQGILHPKRIFKGVRAGVRDYGNRMGIPTVNGAILFDNRYLGNPLVYCGTAGILPKGFHKKAAKPGDAIVVIGARTGKDGIHGATFSSAELHASAPVSAVQIGNAIEEKKFSDVLLKCRDLCLYNSVTDCGAGGFSSAIGEMGSELGAEVWLEKAPLKYMGLKPWGIWLSESQERMILAVPTKNVQKLLKMFAKEDVEATVIGKFTNDKKLKLFYHGDLVGQLDMQFLHKGVPTRCMKAIWKPKKHKEPKFAEPSHLDDALHTLLKMPNIASKETTIRQYDHEVQGGSVLKPLVGAENDGPSDAAIVRPLLNSNEGLVIANGINPKFSDIDPYWMAASAVDEAVRNGIAAGGDFSHIALLDNFCWGSPDHPEKLGELVRTAKACHDIATAFGTPFISGKDSFYNEFKLDKKTISVPSTLLISAMGVLKDVNQRISMDFKEPGNLIYLVGKTFNELGGSHYFASKGAIGNNVPKVNAKLAAKQYAAISKISAAKNVIRSMHDCSEGGIAVALAEMSFAGMLGAEIDAKKIPRDKSVKRTDYLLFSESNSRLIVEGAKGKNKQFEKMMKGIPHALIGVVVDEAKLHVKGLNGKTVVDSFADELKQSWKSTLNW